MADDKWQMDDEQAKYTTQNPKSPRVPCGTARVLYGKCAECMVR